MLNCYYRNKVFPAPLRADVILNYPLRLGRFDARQYIIEIGQKVAFVSFDKNSFKLGCF